MISEKTYAVMSAVSYLNSPTEDDEYEFGIGSTLSEGVTAFNTALQATGATNLLQLADGTVDHDWTLMDFVEEGSSGLQLQTWKNDSTCEVVVSFRGTESLLDILNDGIFALGAESLQQKWVEEYYSILTNTMDDLDISGYAISSTGHSLGGFLADWFADCAFHNFGADISTYAFNPPMPPLTQEETYDNNHTIVFSDPFFWGAKGRLVHDGLTTNLDAEYRIALGAEDHGINSIVNSLELSGPSVATEDYILYYVAKMKSGTLEANDYYAASEFLMAIKDNWEQRVPGTLAAIQTAMAGHVYEVTLDGDYEADGITEALTAIDDGLVHTVSAGSNDDLININDGLVKFSGGSGEDTVSFAGASEAIISSQTSVGSKITYNRGGFVGNTSSTTEVEEVIGSTHADIFTVKDALTIRAGGGNDTVTGDDLNDTIHGDAGVDSLVGGKGSDEIHGGADDDTIIGGEGNDTLYGDGGADFFEAGGGNDIIIGGDDAEGIYDWLRYRTVTDRITHLGKDYGIVVDRDTVRHSVSDVEYTDHFEGIELFAATNNNDYIFGVDAAKIYGGDGHDQIFMVGGEDFVNQKIHIYSGSDNDTIIGGLGNDVVDAGAGNDRFYSSDGVDSFKGGSGFDWYDFSLATEGVNIKVTNTSNKVINNDGFGNKEYIWSGQEIEAIQGSDHADSLNLKYSTVTEVHGGEGNDVIHGSGNKDRIYGDEGDDWLVGNNGDDSIYGGADNDVLKGWGGNDHLWGGSGNDYFELAYTGTDIIHDFEGAGVADGDRIYLHGRSSVSIGTGQGQVHFVDLSNGMTQVRYNEDSDSTYERLMNIDDGAVLASAYTVDDFIFSV